MPARGAELSINDREHGGRLELPALVDKSPDKKPGHTLQEQAERQRDGALQVRRRAALPRCPSMLSDPDAPGCCPVAAADRKRLRRGLMIGAKVLRLSGLRPSPLQVRPRRAWAYARANRRALTRRGDCQRRGMGRKMLCSGCTPCEAVEGGG